MKIAHLNICVDSNVPNMGPSVSFANEVLGLVQQRIDGSMIVSPRSVPVITEGHAAIQVGVSLPKDLDLEGWHGAISFEPNSPTSKRYHVSICDTWLAYKDLSDCLTAVIEQSHGCTGLSCEEPELEEGEGNVVRLVPRTDAAAEDARAILLEKLESLKMAVIEDDSYTEMVCVITDSKGNNCRVCWTRTGLHMFGALDLAKDYLKSSMPRPRSGS